MGYIHIMSGILKTAVEKLKSKYKLIQMAENMVKKAVNNLNKSDNDIFLEYRSKAESLTRYWKKVDLYMGFFVNMEQIRGIFENKHPNDEEYVAYKANRYSVEWVLVYLIKPLLVCLYISFFHFSYLKNLKFSFLIFNVIQKKKYNI